jgi:hypothetical protein
VVFGKYLGHLVAGFIFWSCGIYVWLCIFHEIFLALEVFEVMTYSLRFRHCIALVSVHVLILALPDCFFSLLFSGIPVTINFDNDAKEHVPHRRD